MRLSNLNELYAQLKNPDAGFRSLPFWGWNERMRHDELRRQIADMKDKGMGGAFIHSREGLETPYLSDEWMEDVRVSAEALRENALETWIYDEDKWPSGSAGGLVSQSSPDLFTAKGLTLEARPFSDEELEIRPGEKLIARTRARVEGRSIIAFDEGETQLILRREISRPSEWYNGFAPSDTLNSDAVRRFIELTHEKYKAYFKGDLSGNVEGFFTDEPNCFDFFSSFTPGRPWLPWTDDFIDEFRTRRGYDPASGLFALFYDTRGCERIRHDYWRTVTELFGERCLKQMYDWCEQNGVCLTGHMLYENDMGYNIRVCGAAMPQYRYMHAPGIDILGEQTREYLTVKQAVSVASQYGRDTVISETYGCTGWEFDFEGQKWLGDWQFVLGVTRRCQHLMQYSITGCRKRDYPPVFNEQNTWWRYNRLMEDYYARLSACATTGEARRSILVIHPISSLWTKCASAPDEDLNNIEMNMGWKDPQFVELNARGDSYNRLAEALVRAHWDFDFGDETILSEIGCVDGSYIRVGQNCYDTVIVPEVCSLFASTVELIEGFTDQSGRVLWLGEAPPMVEGKADDRGRSLFNRHGIVHPKDFPALIKILELMNPAALRATSRLGVEDENILTMLRTAGDETLLIAVNHSRIEAREVCFRVPARGRVTAFDPWTNTRRKITCQETGASLCFIDNINPVGSRVYFIESDKTPKTGDIAFAYRHPHRADNVFAALGPTARFRRTMPNALVLDRCLYSLNGKDLSHETEVWQAQREVRDALGMRQVYYNGASQRYRWLDEDAKIPGAPFRMEFAFDVDDVPETPCHFAVEKPRGFRVYHNGVLCSRAEGWFIDRGVALFDLPAMRKGQNVVAIEGDYTADIELEDVFVLGDFAVAANRHIVKEPEVLRFGDWCLQGYPHYAGGVIYQFELPKAPDNNRVVLRMGRYEGVLAEIRVGGVRVDALFGKCRREADLTDFLTDDINLVEIEVCGTPRNLLGPLHQAYDGCSRISWEDFRTEGALHCDEYTLKPYGLMSRIILCLE